MVEKSGTKNGDSGKKNLPNYLTRAKIILEAISLGEMPMTIRQVMTKEYGISKALFSADIHRMMLDGWLEDINPMMNKYKFYRLTDVGRTVLSGWETSEKKMLTKIENARHVTTIRNDKHLREFLQKPEYGFKLNEDFRNVKNYYGKVDGKSIGIYIGNQTTMVITPQPLYARDLITGHHRIHQTILDFCSLMNKKWLFELTIPEPTTHRQYTISDQFAKDMMKLTGGSPIKYSTLDGTEISIDQSKDGKRSTEPRLEVNKLEIAQKYGDTPDLVRLLFKKVEENSEIVNNVVSSNIMLAENMNKLSEQVGKLLGSQVKAGKQESQPEFPLNNSTKSIYG